MALGHLAVSSEIQDLVNERSKEAEACRLFYDQAINETLRDFPWPFAAVIVNLALVEEDPNIEWQFSYRLPADSLKFRRILSGISRIETPSTRVPYRIVRDSVGQQLVLTDAVEPVYGEYTAKVTDPEQFPPDFVEAVSLLLAGMIGPRVTGGDQFKLADRAIKLYEWRVINARINAANEEQPDVPPDSEFITVRN
jgi:hypothetical protein